jgi:hypothetical protein
MSLATTNDRRTARRAENLRRLVCALQLRTLSRDDIAWELGLSPSGVLGYVRDLDPLLAVIDGGRTVQRSYRLNADPELVAEFLASLDERPERRGARIKDSRSHLAVALRDPGRHLHLMQDDVNFAIRLSRAPVRRDPMVAALFGPARAGLNPGELASAQGFDAPVFGTERPVMITESVPCAGFSKRLEVA